MSSAKKTDAALDPFNGLELKVDLDFLADLMVDLDLGALIGDWAESDILLMDFAFDTAQLEAICGPEEPKQ